MGQRFKNLVTEGHFKTDAQAAEYAAAMEAAAADGNLAEFLRSNPAFQGTTITAEILATGGASAGIRNALTTDVSFKTAHYASRLEAAGLNVGRVESAVLNEVSAMQGNMAVGASVGGRLGVDGVTIEYRAMMLESGQVNVGTIFPVR